MPADPVNPCPYGDPTCPCQDADMCHYEGERPMTPPTGGPSDAAVEASTFAVAAELTRQLSHPRIDNARGFDAQALAHAALATYTGRLTEERDAARIQRDLLADGLRECVRAIRSALTGWSKDSADGLFAAATHAERDLRSVGNLDTTDREWTEAGSVFARQRCIHGKTDAEACPGCEADETADDDQLTALVEERRVLREALMGARPFVEEGQAEMPIASQRVLANIDAALGDGGNPQNPAASSQEPESGAEVAGGR